MSATIGGAIKALLEASGLGLAVVRDLPPKGQPLPYVSVTEGIAVDWTGSGDFGDPDADLEVREEVQVEVIQAWKVGDGDRAETYGLPQAVARALRGRTPPAVLGGHVYPLRVLSSVRLPPAPGERGNLIRDVLTVSAVRVVTGATVAP